MTEHIDFELFLKEKLRDHNLTVKKLSELSGVSVKHLENLAAGRFEKLPPAPYLHGYLARIGEILGFDGEAWWGKLKDEGVMRGSGPEDTLPKNRFARAPVNKRIVVISAVILILLFFVNRFSKIVGTPDLLVHYPPEETTTVATETLAAYGTVTPGATLTINGEPIEVTKNGAWRKDILLEPGLNTIEIKAQKFLGSHSSALRQVVYEPLVQSMNSQTSTTPVQ